jgi:hypothetical protein
MNRLCKWRLLLAGWQLGTRPKGDPECDAVSDHRELSLILRAESSALVALLVDKGVITLDEWYGALEREAVQLNADLEQRFPGVTAADDGLRFDKRALPWIKGWRP